MLVSSMLLFSCKKENNNPAAAAGEVVIEFDNRAGSNELALFAKYYRTESGDSVKLTTLKYYISNVELVREDGSHYRPLGVHQLVDELDDDSHKLHLEDVPAGNYKAIRFLFGVDSLQCLLQSDTGVFAPAKGMRYSDNSGPIMLKLEGLYNGNKSMKYWIGGWQDHATNAAQHISLSQGSFTVADQRQCAIHLFVDVLSFFKSPNAIKVADKPLIQALGADAKKVADNAADVFTIDHIHNE